MDIMEGCSKEKSRREGEIIRKGPRRMGPFGPLNSDLQEKIPDQLELQTSLTAENAVKAWYQNLSIENGIRMQMINHDTSVVLAIAYVYATNYGAVLYFGHSVDGIKTINYINGSWTS